MDGLKTANMCPLPTSQHWSSIRTDDDIQKTVKQFIQESGHMFQSRNWQESATDVSQWLGTQIQQEREGWMFKIRMAMQEIDTNRREALKMQAALQECTDQLEMIVECCNVDEVLLQKMSKEDPKRSLPMYIECLAEILNNLIEDKVQCLQMLMVKDTTGSLALSTALKKYLHRNQVIFEKQQNDAHEKQEYFELANAKLNSEINKLKKLIQQKHEDIIALRKQLQGIQEIEEVTPHTNTGNGKETRKLKKRTVLEFNKFVLPCISHVSERSSQSPSHGATNNKEENAVIHMSEDKLNRLRKSAKKLENSLQDALTQLDTFRQRSETSKHKETQQIPGKFPQPQSIPHGGYPTLPKRDLRRVQNLAQWKAKFEVINSSGSEDGDSAENDKLQFIQSEQKPKQRKISTVPQTSRDNQRSSEFEGFTFRSLVESLDEMKSKTSNHKNALVSKTCLRCKKLYTSNDNDKKACRYHPKGKQKFEDYNVLGKLVCINYIWQCCSQGADNPGCCVSQHV